MPKATRIRSANKSTSTSNSNSNSNSRAVAAGFLLPALLLLGALVVYPIGYSVQRSFFDRSGSSFVGLDNYLALVTDDSLRTAVQNNLIWLVLAPAVATALGLLFAVLTERIRWGTAFKLVVFMPMAISMLAAGIIFRLVYEQDPDRGVANAVWVGVHDTFAESSGFPGPGRSPCTRSRRPAAARTSPRRRYAPGSPSGCRSSGWLRAGCRRRPARPPSRPRRRPPRTRSAERPGWTSPRAAAGSRTSSTRPNRASPGCGSRPYGTARWSPRPRRRPTAPSPCPPTAPTEPYSASPRATSGSSTTAWSGWAPRSSHAAVIGAYVWMWAGFAMVLIGAGLAAVPRELLEAARVDGANEWQVFRRITVPLLAPVLAVVLVTLMINVLKVFDLVFVIAPGSAQDDANVLALQLYRSSFGTDADLGVGSAIAVVLLLLVLPVMAVNIRRIRRETRR